MQKMQLDQNHAVYDQIVQRHHIGIHESPMIPCPVIGPEQIGKCLKNEERRNRAVHHGPCQRFLVLPGKARQIKRPEHEQIPDRPPSSGHADHAPYRKENPGPPQRANPQLQRLFLNHLAEEPGNRHPQPPYIHHRRGHLAEAILSYMLAPVQIDQSDCRHAQHRVSVIDRFQELSYRKLAEHDDHDDQTGAVRSSLPDIPRLIGAQILDVVQRQETEVI